VSHGLTPSDWIMTRTPVCHDSQRTEIRSPATVKLTVVPATVINRLSPWTVARVGDIDVFFDDVASKTVITSIEGVGVPSETSSR